MATSRTKTEKVQDALSLVGSECERFDEAMREEYRQRGITKPSQLSEATGISKPTCKALLNSPHKATWLKLQEACEALGIDVGEVCDAASGHGPADRDAFDADYEMVRARLASLVRHFLKLSADQQDTVLAMVAGVTPKSDVAAHRAACATLANQVARLEVPHVKYDGNRSAIVERLLPNG